jgi:hypothetical protein
VPSTDFALILLNSSGVPRYFPPRFGLKELALLSSLTSSAPLPTPHQGHWHLKISDGGCTWSGSPATSCPLLPSETANLPLEEIGALFSDEVVVHMTADGHGLAEVENLDIASSPRQTSWLLNTSRTTRKHLIRWFKRLHLTVSRRQMLDMKMSERAE